MNYLHRIFNNEQRKTAKIKQGKTATCSNSPLHFLLLALLISCNPLFFTKGEPGARGQAPSLLQKSLAPPGSRPICHHWASLEHRARLLLLSGVLLLYLWFSSSRNFKCCRSSHISSVSSWTLDYSLTTDSHRAVRNSHQTVPTTSQALHTRKVPCMSHRAHSNYHRNPSISGH